jgi:DNA gyrase subunit A
MGRATSGVKGMGLRKEDEVIAAGIADDELDMLVVTDQGYGKRTRMKDYPIKGRGGLGVKTVQLTKARGQLAGALAVRDGYQVMLISNGGTVIRMPAEEIKRLGRATQGVIVMRLRGDEQVSSIALVAESDEAVAADAAEGPVEPEPAPPAISDKNE